MRPSCVQIAILLPLLVLQVMVIAGDTNPTALSSSSSSSSSSPWLKRVTNPRATGCWLRPWICNSGERFPPRIRRLCCRNRCVDVMTDVNNCGLCGIRCPFTWQCCNGFCVDTNANPFHCGRCWNRCPFGSLCFFGLCGYAQLLPPFPFPSLPRPPTPSPPSAPQPRPPATP